MITRNLAKFAAVLALSTGLVAAGANASHAGGLEKPLLGGALGAVAGAGAGYAFGKGPGAAIGGIMGLALGAVITAHLDKGDRHAEQVYDGYVPPPPVHGQAPVYQPAQVAYEPQPYPTYGNAPYGAADPNTCQPYGTTTTVNGVAYPSQGTVCLQPDGTWRVVN